MDLSFRRAARPIFAAGAIALVSGFSAAPLLHAQAAAGAAAQPTRNYKDAGEYDLYLKASQSKDPKALLQILNTWQDKYPTSDFAKDRLQYFIAALMQLAPTDPSQRPVLLAKCQEMQKLDPNYFQANYATSLWGPVVGGATPQPDLVTQVETAAKALTGGGVDAQFDDSKKPAAVAADMWAKYKGGASAIAHNALAWVAVTRKDTAAAESEYRASLAANPEQGGVSVQLGKLLVETKDNKKVPDGLYEYARATQYSGPSAVPAETRTKLMQYFTTAYKNFHGSDEGMKQVLDSAATNALPPSGFTITNAQDQANDEAKKLQARIDSDPAFKLWYTIESSLKDKGDSFFTSTVKDAEIPGGAQGVKYFKGTVLTADTSKVTLGVEDPTKADTTLLFTTPIKDTELAKIKVGDALEFGGVASSWAKEPYMLTFKDPTIPGVETSAPAATGRKKR